MRLLIVGLLALAIGACGEVENLLGLDGDCGPEMNETLTAYGTPWAITRTGDAGVMSETWYYYDINLVRQFLWGEEIHGCRIIDQSTPPPVLGGPQPMGSGGAGG